MKAIIIVIIVGFIIYGVNWLQEKTNKDVCKILKSKNDVSYYEICK